MNEPRTNYEIATGHPEPPADLPGGWVSLREHLEAIRAGDLALAAERDRRYAEVTLEREKALRIKEAADDRALNLARDIQIYKDEKANELREQINSERGLYATKADIATLDSKFDAAHKPVVEFMASALGRTTQSADTRLNVNTIIQAVSLLIAAIVVYAAFHH